MNGWTDSWVCGVRVHGYSHSHTITLTLALTLLLTLAHTPILTLSSEGVEEFLLDVKSAADLPVRLR